MAERSKSAPESLARLAKAAAYLSALVSGLGGLALLLTARTGSVLDFAPLAAAMLAAAGGAVVGRSPGTTVVALAALAAAFMLLTAALVSTYQVSLIRSGLLLAVVSTGAAGISSLAAVLVIGARRLDE